jgi:response regulator RpfG family c-di-GMP phosphodiesterase
MNGMTTNSTLLCIHRDTAELSLLKENGYELATATNGSDGLKLFMSRPVHAVILEYHLGLLDGATIADQIKRIRPEVPVVMLVDHVELPADALKSVDALVVKSDGPHFLLATVHFVLTVKPAQRHESKIRAKAASHLRRPGRSRAAADLGMASPRPADSRPANPRPANPPLLATDGKGAPFSRDVWRGIRNGTVQS